MLTTTKHNYTLHTWYRNNAASRSLCLSILLMIAAFALTGPSVAAFAPLGSSNRLSTLGQTKLHASSNDDGFFSDDDTACLQHRLAKMRLEILEEEMHHPPNASLEPHEVALQLLKGLRHADDPLPDAGFRRLLRASTPRWRKLCYKSVGAPLHSNEELVASALGDAIGRPNNQFDILTKGGYVVKFPRLQPVYNEDDNTCWMECQLLSMHTNELLVTIGLQLWERPSDGAWLLHKIDWQDFRERYRPGIGREDWMRDTMRRLGCL